MELSTRAERLSFKLYLIYALNIADWICTVVLTRSGGFYEANPLMQPVFGSITLSLVLKGILPAVLITVLSRLLKLLDGSGLRRSDAFISFVLTYYVGLCTIHVLNFVLLFLRLRA